MKTTEDNRTLDELKEEMTRLFKEHLEYLANDCLEKSISMTDATESIWGTSGRGNPKAVRIIETLAEYKLVTITGTLKRRRVQISAVGKELLKG